MYVCMYVCMHACIHACMHVCMYVCMYIYIYIYAQWLERRAQEAGGPGFDPHLVELSGLWVRPFKVSGGSPHPPPEQTPVVTSKDSSSLKKQEMYIYIYIYTYVCICIC